MFLTNTKEYFLEVRDRLKALESRESPEPTIEIPVVNAEGEAVKKNFYGYPFPETRQITVQEAFDALQEACGVEIKIEKGTTDSIQAYK